MTVAVSLPRSRLTELVALARRQIESLHSTLVYYRRFARFVGIFHWLLLQALGAFGAMMNAVGIVALFPLLKVILSDKQEFLSRYIYPRIPAERLPVFLTDHLVVTFSVIAVGIYTAKFLFVVSYATLGSYWADRYSAQIRERILNAYSSILDRRVVRDDKSLVLHLTNQVFQFTSYSWALVDTSLKFYTLLFIFILVVLTSFKFLTLAAPLAALVFFALYPFLKWTHRTSSRYFENQQDLVREVSSLADGIETIRTMGLLERQQDRIRTTVQRLIHNVISLSMSRQITFSLPEYLLVAAVLTFVAIKNPTGGDFAYFAITGLALSRFLNALNDLSSRFSTTLELQKVPEEIYKYVEDREYGAQVENRSARFEGPVDRIRIDNLSVEGPDGPLLSQITLEIPCGCVTQLVGGNGSGKSTLLRCLAKLMPYEGSIQINGVELKGIAQADWYSRLAYHGQDNFLFPGTILENLIAAAPGKTEADVRSLAAAIGFSFDELFAEGLQYRVAEGMKNISGGERQLVCLVRTLLRDADVYVLDEFVNHLSSVMTEKFIVYLKALREKTVLMVVHQPIGFRQHAFYFQEGRLVDARGEVNV